MVPQDSGSMARQFVRKATRRAARIEPDPVHADQFRLAFPDAQSEVFVTDVSKGGLGLATSVFIPRSLKLIVHVTGHDQRDLCIPVIARRCALSDHKPNYIVGLQFCRSEGEPEAELLKLVMGDPQEPDPEAPAP